VKDHGDIAEILSVQYCSIERSVCQVDCSTAQYSKVRPHLCYQRRNHLLV